MLFTGNRAEFALQVPIIRAIKEHKNLDYYLVVSGAHLEKAYGKTINEIKKEQLEIKYQLKIEIVGEDLFSTTKVIGESIVKLTKLIKSIKPDMFLVYGDRFETFAAAIASSQTNTVTCHVEGGDITQGGAMDDSIRHAISKLSHLHFVTNNQSMKNLLSMGEEKWRVHNVGYTGMDLIKQKEYLCSKEIKTKLKIDLSKPIIVFTQHSVTNKYEMASKQFQPSILAIKKFVKEYDAQCIIIYPNNDAGSKKIISKILQLSSSRNFFLFKSLDRKVYWGLLALAKYKKYKIICLGNSSSGIKDAPAFGCPVINIGTRQEGRLRAHNVIDCDYNEKQIYNAIMKGFFDSKFREYSKTPPNPYGTGNAGKKIASILAKSKKDDILLTKKVKFK